MKREREIYMQLEALGRARHKNQYTTVIVGAVLGMVLALVGWFIEDGVHSAEENTKQTRDKVLSHDTTITAINTLLPEVNKKVDRIQNQVDDVQKTQRQYQPPVK